MTANIKIYNLPPYLLRQHTVVRLDHGKLWFYGTYDDAAQAERIALELGNGFVVEGAQI